MPEASKRRARVQRTKTFNGCWTCRARHVKCDGLRPRCNRCAKSKIECEGYGIRLSWSDDGSSRNDSGKNRLQFSHADMLHPIFSHEEINAALELVDSDHVGIVGLEAGPYTVFSVDICSVLVYDGGCKELKCLDWPLRLEEEQLSSVSLLGDAILGDAEGTLGFKSQSLVPFHSPMDSSNSVSEFEQDVVDCDFEAEEVVHTSFDTDVVYSRLMPVTQMRLKPVLQSFFESSSVEERMLLRFWITCGSSRMISTGHPDNPYRHVFVPLAMAALGSGKRLAGNYALLHSIYAWAASNMAQLQDQQNSENTRVQASSHYQLSLAYLRESLDVGDVEQQGATLAAIVLITTMDIVNGESYKWRIHLQGGRVWLKSVSTTWQNIPDNQIIYQVFRGLEVFGYSHDKLLIHPNDWSASEQELNESETLEEPFTSLANDPDGDAYCLDRYFGITKPVLDIIWAIKRISKRGSGPTLVEISDIEEQLMKANPSILRFSCPTESIERLTRHHACSFYFACVTAFKRSLLHCHPSDVQYLVEQSLFHLEATMAAEIKMELTVTGLLWPLFVTSAEAADQLLRERCLRVFEFRKTQGVLSVAQTEDVVLEIWRRRDASLNPEYVHRHEVMEDLGADILLA